MRNGASHGHFRRDVLDHRRPLDRRGLGDLRNAAPILIPITNSTVAIVMAFQCARSQWWRGAAGIPLDGVSRSAEQAVQMAPMVVGVL